MIGKCNKKVLKEKRELLSSDDINEIMMCYQRQFPNFAFLGALPDDAYKEYIASEYTTLNNFDLVSLYKKGKRRFGIVFNTDPSTKKGKHWVAMFIVFGKEKPLIEYFDSVGRPPKKSVLKFINRFIEKAFDINKSHIQFKINRTIHQPKEDEWNCGIYVLYFLIMRLNGVSFEKLNNEITEKNIEKFRNILTKK